MFVTVIVADFTALQAPELLDEISKLHKSSTLDEERVNNTNQTLEDSMNTKKEVELNLTMCCNKDDLAPLEKKVKGLNVMDLNRKVCFNQNCHMSPSVPHILGWMMHDSCISLPNICATLT